MNLFFGSNVLTRNNKHVALTYQQGKTTIMTKEVELRLGEKIMPKAPRVQLSNGAYCVPQHYLTYHHTLQSVEALLCDIDYDEKYAIFASQDSGGIYIQIGVVGHDNYQASVASYQANSANNGLKLLFGRKWRVEPELPTSEIIQTVFLAIKKSREHEVRELFKLKLGNSTTTPFNSHIDLPLMAEFSDLSSNKDKVCAETTINDSLENIVNSIQYDGCKFSLKQLEQRSNGLWLVDLSYQKSTVHSATDNETTIYLQVADLSLNTLCRALMAELINISDAHVDKHFSYKGFHRFDPAIDIAHIADLSQQTRQQELAAHFAQEFTKTNYQVDQMRIPTVSSGPLAQKNKAILEQFNIKTR